MISKIWCGLFMTLTYMFLDFSHFEYLKNTSSGNFQISRVKDFVKKWHLLSTTHHVLKVNKSA